MAALALAAAFGCAPSVASSPASPSPPRPNIVLVLTDDLSMNLVQFLPQVLQLQRDGTSFSQYTVTDSLCCPSRASIFTGRYPHNTGVFTNHAPDGGFRTFRTRGNENATVATALQRVGYRTAMMGKYLNGYRPEADVDGSGTYVPPGWDEWDVAGDGYPEFDYVLNENHELRPYGSAPADYLTDVLAAKAEAFVTSSAAARTPFFLEVATFAPHAPYRPAPRDKDAFPGLTAPRGPAFDTVPTDAPAWLASRAALTPDETNRIDEVFRKRAQAVQAIDQLIGSVRAAVERAGAAQDTIIMFSSDNGYHLGEHRLNPGKMTAFDTDVVVPLVVAGPRVRAGAIVAVPAQNVDLLPTFEDLAGAGVQADVDGHSLLPLLTGEPDGGWRTASLIEHHGPDTDTTDPDAPPKDSGNPPTYEALRTATVTYVEYADGSREYYDRVADPDQLHNTYAQLPPSTQAALHTGLQALASCEGAQACWAAGHPAL